MSNLFDAPWKQPFVQSVWWIQFTLPLCDRHAFSGSLATLCEFKVVRDENKRGAVRWIEFQTTTRRFSLPFCWSRLPVGSSANKILGLIMACFASQCDPLLFATWQLRRQVIKPIFQAPLIQAEPSRVRCLRLLFNKQGSVTFAAQKGLGSIRSFGKQTQRIHCSFGSRFVQLW